MTFIICQEIIERSERRAAADTTSVPPRLDERFRYGPSPPPWNVRLVASVWLPDGRGFIIPKLTRKDQPKAACNVRSRKGRPHRITESQYHCQSREDHTCAIFCLALRVVRFSPPAIVRDKRVWLYGRNPLEITHDSIPCGNTKNENAWFQLAGNRKIRLE